MLLFILIWAGLPPDFSYEAPNSAAFKGWARKFQEESSDIDPYAWERAALACDRPGIFPTHPQMSLKRYHLVLSGQYDHLRLRGNDQACAIGGKKPDGRGIVPCFRPDILHYALLSDTYQDACGHLFRGVKEAAFFRRHETMSTLFSPGRAVIPKPSSEFKEFIVAPTKAAAPEDFLFFLQLLPGDEGKIAEERDKALKGGFIYNESTGLFERL